VAQYKDEVPAPPGLNLYIRPIPIGYIEGAIGKAAAPLADIDVIWLGLCASLGDYF